MSRFVRVGIVAVAALAASPALASAKSFAIESVPAPAAASSSTLNAVSCPAEDSCMAVGFWEASSTSGPGFTDQPFAERWDGTGWSQQDMPDPGRANNVILTGVSCSSASACTAVGYTEAFDGTPPACALGGDCGPAQPAATVSFTPIAERWNGQVWQVQTVVNSAPQTQLLGVSCSSLASCTAVGTGEGPGSQSTAPVAEQWNGNSWSTLGTQQPPDTTFAAVSCLDSGDCVAAGQRPAGPLADQWDGFVWIPQATDDPFEIVSGNTPAFTGASCTGATVCTAVGYDQAGSGASAGPAFAEQQNEGAPWHYQAIGSPAGATGVQLNGVSCLRAWECHAVGTYYGGSGGNGRPLWAYWDGIGWRPSKPPAPVGSSQSTLRGISCTQDQNCMAVGTAATGTGAPFVVRYS